MSQSFLRLKSGSDVRGVAVAQQGAPATLTDDIGKALGASFANWLGKKLGKPTDALSISVGMDSRISGTHLKDAMLSGIASAGATALDCGLCTTPAMFMSTMLLPCDGAVMVTASHLPWERNGYKFFTPEGGLDGEDIDVLLNAASVVSLPEDIAQFPNRDLPGAYVGHLKKMVTNALGGERPLRSLHIVVDAGNGAGGFYAQMLADLGADIMGSQFLEPDGHFPNHVPNPEDPQAMLSLSNAVMHSHADLGVIFDADCDRAAMVDAEGRTINRNRLIALVGAMLLEETPGITVVTDSVVSAGLDSFLASHGGALHRFKRGYRNVIDEAIRLNGEGVDCPLAMETSGHAALRENHFLDDGMYLVTRLIIQAQKMRLQGKTLDALIADLAEPLETVEIRLPIQAEDFRAAGEKIIANMLEQVNNTPSLALDAGNREGVRVQFDSPDNWVMMRLSVHDPLLVINAESGRAGGVAHMLATLYGMLSTQAELDLTALEARMNPSV